MCDITVGFSTLLLSSSFGCIVMMAGRGEPEQSAQMRPHVYLEYHRVPSYLQFDWISALLSLFPPSLLLHHRHRRQYIYI